MNLAFQFLIEDAKMPNLEQNTNLDQKTKNNNMKKKTQNKNKSEMKDNKSESIATDFYKLKSYNDWANAIVRLSTMYFECLHDLQQIK